MLTWPARRALLRTQPSGHVPPPHRCANLPVGCAASYAPLAPVGCVNDCMGRGSCHDGVCECQPGWTYFDCSIRAPTRGALAPPPRAPTPASPGPPPPCAGTCAADCSGAGLCFNGTCQCRDGFCGGDCSQRCCPNGCSGRGTCEQNGGVGTCRCNPGYDGADCSLRVCPNDCSGHGSCAVPAGEPLSVRAFGLIANPNPNPNPCPKPNPNQVRAAWAPVCTCDVGYTGFDCSLEACPKP